jgi:hypothetical protein
MPPRKFWDRTTALRALWWEAKRLGRTPTQRDLRSPDRTCPSESVYRDMFGGLYNACVAAGLPGRRKGRNTGWRKPKCRRGHDRTRRENIDSQGHCRLCAAHWKSRRGRGPLRVHPIILKQRAQRITEQKRQFWRAA